MKKKEWKKAQGVPGSGAVFGLGFIGAAVYYIQQADTVWEIILALLKGMVWPALLIHRALSVLGA